MAIIFEILCVCISVGSAYAYEMLIDSHNYYTFKTYLFFHMYNNTAIHVCILHTCMLIYTHAYVCMYYACTSTLIHVDICLI